MSRSWVASVVNLPKKEDAIHKLKLCEEVFSIVSNNRDVFRGETIVNITNDCASYYANVGLVLRAAEHFSRTEDK